MSIPLAYVQARRTEKSLMRDMTETLQLAHINKQLAMDARRRKRHFKMLKAKRGPTLRERSNANLQNTLGLRITRVEARRAMAAAVRFKAHSGAVV